MATGATFPTTLDAFTDKVDGIDDILAVETNTQSSAIEALEAKVGIDGSADTDSLDYKINNVIISNPTTTRGDILVRDAVGLARLALGARGSIPYSDGTDLEYLALGANGTVLTSDGTDAAWSSPASPIPSGSINPFAGITVPSGWLACDGSAVSRATYADLFAALTLSKGTFTVTIASPGLVTLTSHGLITGDEVSLTTTSALPTGLTASTNYWVIYNDANSFWLATTYANALAATKINTSGSQSGVHTLLYNPHGISGASNFLVPDLRAATLRGSGTSTAFTQNQTINLGGVQDDQAQGHYHNHEFGVVSSTGSGKHYLTIFTNGNVFAAPDPSTDIMRVLSPSTDGTNGTPRTGNETRMKNIGVKFIIKT